MKLSIIIVNYKTCKLVLNCIASIYKYNVNDVEIILVDNDSKDEIEMELKRYYPNTLFLQMGYNAGFARANNAGIRIAKGELILLLNSDTVNLNDAVNKCCSLLEKSEYLAAGVQLLNEDLTPQISGNFAMKGGLNYLLPLPFVGNLLKFVAMSFKVKKPSIENAASTIEVDWINGAFLMIKKEVIEKAGLLDEDFFLYAEEAEWCSRIKKNGTLCIFGQLNVLHLQGESANTAFNSEGKGYFNLYDKKGLQIMLSNFVRIRKQFGLFWFLFDFLVYLITVPLFFVGIIFQQIFMKQKYQFIHVKGFAKNIFKLLKFIPRIVLNKPFFYKAL